MTHRRYRCASAFLAVALTSGATAANPLGPLVAQRYFYAVQTAAFAPQLASTYERVAASRGGSLVVVANEPIRSASQLSRLLPLVTQEALREYVGATRFAELLGWAEGAAAPSYVVGAPDLYVQIDIRSCIDRG